MEKWGTIKDDKVEIGTATVARVAERAHDAEQGVMAELLCGVNIKGGTCTLVPSIYTGKEGGGEKIISK